MEAAEGGVEFIVGITEGVPAHDEAWFFNKLKRDFPDVQLLGPNCPGIISPGKANIGITAGHIAKAPVAGRAQRRHREPLRHAHLPGALRAQAQGHRRHHLRRHRRRPGAGHQLHRLPRGLRGRPRHQGRDDDRRDRRLGRGRGRRVHRRQDDQAGRRPTSPASPRPPARRWATPAPSSRAARARRPPRWRRSQAAGVQGRAATPPRPASSWSRSSPSSERADAPRAGRRAHGIVTRRGDPGPRARSLPLAGRGGAASSSPVRGRPRGADDRAPTPTTRPRPRSPRRPTSPPRPPRRRPRRPPSRPSPGPALAGGPPRAVVTPNGVVLAVLRDQRRRLVRRPGAVRWRGDRPRHAARAAPTSCSIPGTAATSRVPSAPPAPPRRP